MLRQMNLLPTASEAVEPVFSRHETFHPRYGWLKKAFDAAVDQPDVFLRDDATVTLGVGKNMVRAMRYWAEAFKVLDRTPNAERPRLDDSIPTPFGERLLGAQGRDPYLERRETLWLLHWTLFERPCIAPSWYVAMATISSPTVTSELLEGEVLRFCEEQPDWTEVAKNSVKKDVRCLLKMYAAVSTGRDLPEDTVDSPFVELGLLQELATKDALMFREGIKRDLPDLLVAYSAVKFTPGDGRGLVPIARLAAEPGSPGAVFKLTESDLTASLQRVAEGFGGIGVTQSAGSAVLTFPANRDELASDLLEATYDGELMLQAA